MKKLFDQLHLRYGVGVRAGEERGKKPVHLPLGFFLSCFSLRFIILRYNSKYQSKGPIYILHLFAFATIRPF